ncbi:MAG: enoyl-CoA hydratase/isomerase family protein [Candidatus Schekmanbacteria bacterium]|nr:enoyl-CoA hydratase/isomerase family protein [Candidatus Schekmanbacteria bacterium]
MSDAILASSEQDGQLERLILNRPKGNVLDLEMIAELGARLDSLHPVRPELKAVMLEGAGGHFSFGASVEQHLPASVGKLLPAFHNLFRQLEALSVPSVAVVRGQCLGGGFELALWCGWIFCDPSARFAVPEIKLAVFPPIAAAALPWRIGGARATDLILTGRAITGSEAVSLGLAASCTDDPEAAFQTWFAASLAPLSPLAVKLAWRASRRPLAAALAHDVPELEALYLDELMRHADPVEGLTAFLERRAPRWTNR